MHNRAQAEMCITHTAGGMATLWPILADVYLMLRLVLGARLRASDDPQQARALFALRRGELVSDCPQAAGVARVPDDQVGRLATKFFGQAL